MTGMARRLALTAVAASVAVTVVVAGCSTDQPSASTTPTTSASAQGGVCQVNPKTEPMPTAEKYRPVPANARISVTTSGIPSEAIKPGDPPAEIDVTLCNDSPVDYPKVGIVTVLTKCSCATSPMGLPQGHVERFDAATNSWVQLEHPVITTGMDYLSGFADEQPLPKGKTVTLRYRIALDPSMTAGKGSVETTVVVPDPLVEIGKADLPFTVLKDSPKETPTPSNPPAATTRQSVVPFTGLTYPGRIAADKDGGIYLTDQGRVVKLAAGSKDQTVLPFTGLQSIGGVAVDNAGNVYVTDKQPRVVRLAAGTNDQTVLPLADLKWPGAVAVDAAGEVFVADGPNNRILKLPAGSNDTTVLPFDGLNGPDDVAVDGADNVYVIDNSGFGRLVKLAAA